MWIIIGIFGVILFVVLIYVVIKKNSQKINTALIQASEKLNFQYTPPESLWRKKVMSGTLNGYRCEITVYTQSHGQSSTTYVSFFTYFPESLNMGIKINWRGQFEGDGDHLSNLFIKRNLNLVEEGREKLRRLKITDEYVSSRKILWKKYYNPDEIVKTMYDVVTLTKNLK